MYPSYSFWCLILRRIFVDIFLCSIEFLAMFNGPLIIISCRFNEAEDKSMHYQIQIETLQIKYDGVTDERDTIMHQVEEMKQTSSIKDKEIASLRNQIVSSESQNKALQDRIVMKQEEIKVLNRAAPDLRSTVKELDESKRQIETVKMELTKSKELEQASHATIKDLQNALAESESKVATVASTAASEKASHTTALNKIEKELQKTSINLDFKIKELNAAKAEIARLKEIPRETKTETIVTTTSERVSNREHDLMVENENLKKFLAELKAHYATLREESVKNKEMAWKEIQALREMQIVECKICSNPVSPVQLTPPRTRTTTTTTILTTTETPLCTPIEDHATEESIILEKASKQTVESPVKSSIKVAVSPPPLLKQLPQLQQL